MANATEDVGNVKIYENDKVKIWLFELEPGASTELHTHRHSYIWYAITGTKLDLTDSDGNPLGVLDVPVNSAWDIRYNDDATLTVANGEAAGASIPATHVAKNITDKPYRELLIEFK